MCVAVAVIAPACCKLVESCCHVQILNVALEPERPQLRQVSQHSWHNHGASVSLLILLVQLAQLCVDAIP
jgi:hypothetical protein